MSFREDYHEVADLLARHEGFNDWDHLAFTWKKSDVDFEDAYEGAWACVTEFARDYLTSYHEIDEVVERYIDWAGVWHGELANSFYSVYDKATGDYHIFNHGPI